jgi:hypothetical protein
MGKYSSSYVVLFQWGQERLLNLQQIIIREKITLRVLIDKKSYVYLVNEKCPFPFFEGPCKFKELPLDALQV